MARKPNKVKAKTRPGKGRRSFRHYITHPKLIIFLLILLAVPVAAVANEKYKDWDNAQMIRGLSEDFPVLVQEIERANGLDLEIQNDCITTQEKFISGVKTCEMIVVEELDWGASDKVERTVRESKKFLARDDLENGMGFYIDYKNTKSCSFSEGARGEGVVAIECLVGVRDANVQLAKEVFSKTY